MAGTPITIDQDEVKKILLSIDGVRDIHDLPIWTITSGLDSLTCHLHIEETSSEQNILQKAIQLIEKNLV